MIQRSASGVVKRVLPPRPVALVERSPVSRVSLACAIGGTVRPAGCGLVVIAYRYGAGDGVNLVFDAATGKLVGGSTWSDVSGGGCFRPRGADALGTQGGVYVDGYLGLGSGYPQGKCPAATKCAPTATDAGAGSIFNPGLQPCTDAGSRDGSASP
jgi:hypothetical protein